MSGLLVCSLYVRRASTTRSSPILFLYLKQSAMVFSAEYTYLNSIAGNEFDAGAERRLGKPKYPKRGILQLRDARMTREGDIHGMRNLSRQTMMEEGRDKTDDRLRDLNTDCRPIRVHERCTGKPVKTSSDLFDFAAVA